MGHKGGVHAGSEFAPLYSDLRAIASRMLQNERPGHTLQATSLVHEAYLRFAGQKSLPGLERAQLLGLIARVMRQVLVDYARTRGRAKRGCAGQRITLDEGHLVCGRDMEIEALEEALVRLEELDPRQAQMVEMRFYGGMTIPEVAEALAISPETVKRDWTMARAWLNRELSGDRRE